MCESVQQKLGHTKTPLHWAAWTGHVKVCQILREYLIDKNPEDNNGHTPYLRYIPN